MKRILNLCVLLFCAATAVVAQTDGTFQFIDKNGSVVADGATVVANTLVEDEFLGNNINSGIFVKNVSGASALARVVYDISTLDNGSLQICFPVTCNTQLQMGTYETATGPVEPDNVRDLESEWFPTAFGRCQATFRIEVMQQMGVFPHTSYVKLADGPSVTVVFDYPDPAGIRATQGDCTEDNRRSYDLLGRQANGEGRALRIVQLSNGRRVKRFVR